MPASARPADSAHSPGNPPRGAESPAASVSPKATLGRRRLVVSYGPDGPCLDLIIGDQPFLHDHQIEAFRRGRIRVSIGMISRRGWVTHVEAAGLGLFEEVFCPALAPEGDAWLPKRSEREPLIVALMICAADGVVRSARQFALSERHAMVLDALKESAWSMRSDTTKADWRRDCDMWRRLYTSMEAAAAASIAFTDNLGS